MNMDKILEQVFLTPEQELQVESEKDRKYLKLCILDKQLNEEKLLFTNESNKEGAKQAEVIWNFAASGKFAGHPSRSNEGIQEVLSDTFQNDSSPIVWNALFTKPDEVLSHSSEVPQDQSEPQENEQN